MDHRGTVGRIYKEDHYILLQIKYESSGPCGFGEEEFFFLFYQLPPPPGAGPVWTPWDHYALLLTKYESSGPCGFGEEDFLCFSHCKSMGANDPRGRAIFDPRGMIGRIYIEDH